jgi:hypothetical protein
MTGTSKQRLTSQQGSLKATVRDNIKGIAKYKRIKLHILLSPNNKQDRQCTYNIIFRRVSWKHCYSGNIITTHNERLCSRGCPASNVHVPYLSSVSCLVLQHFSTLCPVWFYNISPLCVLSGSTTFLHIS